MTFKVPYMATILIIFWGCSEQRENCSEMERKIPILFERFFKSGDKLKLIIDNGEIEYSKKFWYDYESSYPKLIQNYCTAKDSIMIQCWVNEMEFNFSFKVAEVTEIALGKDLSGKLILRKDLAPKARNDYFLDEQNSIQYVLKLELPQKIRQTE